MNSQNGENAADVALVSKSLKRTDLELIIAVSYKNLTPA